MCDVLWAAGTATKDSIQIACNFESSRWPFTSSRTIRSREGLISQLAACVASAAMPTATPTSSTGLAYPRVLGWALKQHIGGGGFSK